MVWTMQGSCLIRLLKSLLSKSRFWFAEFGYNVTVKNICEDRLESNFIGVNNCFVLGGTSNCCGAVWLVGNCLVLRYLPSSCRNIQLRGWKLMSVSILGTV
jgi:hypothetical protein